MMIYSGVFCVWRIECGPGLCCYEAVPEEETRGIKDGEIGTRRVLSFRTASKRTANYEIDIALDAVLFQSWELAHATNIIDAMSLPLRPHRWAKKP